MNFFEAMRAVDEGKVVKSCAGYLSRYKKHLGKLVFADSPRLPHLMADEISGTWKIADPPKKKKKIKFYRAIYKKLEGEGYWIAPQWDTKRTSRQAWDNMVGELEKEVEVEEGDS